MSDSDIIDALGGTGEVAKLCEVTSQAVSQWRQNGIPAAQRRFLKLARADAFAQRPANEAAKQDAA
jgi:phage terminase Nu1 subunit (DNA packaging protein)